MMRRDFLRFAVIPLELTSWLMLEAVVVVVVAAAAAAAAANYRLQVFLRRYATLIPFYSFRTMNSG
jgi:hypothetical protein